MPLIKTYTDIHTLLDIIKNDDRQLCLYCKNSSLCFKNDFFCLALIESALSRELKKHQGVHPCD